MIYDGITTKPSLDELYHEKAHKYVERHKGPKGNWIYTYRTKTANTRNKVKTSKYLKPEDPYAGMGVEGRFAVKAGVKLAQLTLKGADKTKKAIKKIKHNSKHGKYTKNRRV